MSRLHNFFVIFVIFLLLSSSAFAVTTRYIDNVAEVSGGEVSYKINDRLGSQRVIVDEDGEVTAEFKSLPYGQIVEDSGSKYGFTGKEKDVSTGLHYFSARYYDSSTGRFAGVDPVAKNHPYSYVANNPMNYVDPSGMNPGAIALSLESAEQVVPALPSLMGLASNPVTMIVGGVAAAGYGIYVISELEQQRVEEWNSQNTMVDQDPDKFFTPDNTRTFSLNPVEGLIPGGVLSDPVVDVDTSIPGFSLAPGEIIPGGVLSGPVLGGVDIPNIMSVKLFPLKNGWSLAKEIHKKNEHTGYHGHLVYNEKRIGQALTILDDGTLVRYYHGETKIKKNAPKKIVKQAEDVLREKCKGKPMSTPSKKKIIETY